MILLKVLNRIRNSALSLVLELTGLYDPEQSHISSWSFCSLLQKMHKWKELLTYVFTWRFQLRISERVCCLDLSTEWRTICSLSHQVVQMLLPCNFPICMASCAYNLLSIFQWSVEIIWFVIVFLNLIRQLLEKADALHKIFRSSCDLRIETKMDMTVPLESHTTCKVLLHSCYHVFNNCSTSFCHLCFLNHI